MFTLMTGHEIRQLFRTQALPWLLVVTAITVLFAAWSGHRAIAKQTANATLASSIGFVVSVIFNYLMHYSWTFAQPAPHGRTLVRYLAMVACGFGINALVMYVGVHGWALHYLITQALARVAVVLWNFTLSNLWVFRA